MSTLKPQSRLQQDVLAAMAAIVCAIVATVIIWAVKPLLEHFENTLLPDQGAAWYYWKLPNPDFWSHFTAWGGYILHQILAWACIAWGALRARRIVSANACAKAAGQPIQAKFGARLVAPGIAFALVNLVFFGLHLLQTVLFYDGLAQDVPVVSSQGSVIVMLVLILILMNEKRGLFFGHKIPLPAKALAFIRKYHGYYIAWALIYTFWYHPMTSTPAHLAGFLYMLVLLSQGGLMFTRVHSNPRWVVVLEILVLAHGTTVALMQGTPLWTMFFFGFGFMFIVTQMYGLKMPKWVNIGLTALFFGAAVLVYAGWLVPGKELSQIHQILWIPFIEYALVPVFLGLAALGAWVARKLSPGRLAEDRQSEI